MKQARKISRRKATACMAVGCALLLQTSLAFAAAEAAETASTNLDQVVVTANRIPSRLSEAAANVAVVTREEIEKKNYSTVIDVLKDVNGVAITSQGFAGAEQHALLNGDQRVVIMVDGRRLNFNKLAGNYERATYDLNALPMLDNVERIEILKGAGSAQYGSDAVGGVINIITRAGKQNRTTLDINQGSWGTGNYSLTTEGSQKDWSWFVAAGKSHQNSFSYKNYRTGEVVKMPNSAFDKNNLTIRLDKKINADSSLTFNFEHVDDHKGQPWGAISSFKSDDYLNSLSNNVAITYNYKQKTELPAYVRAYQNYYRYDMHSYNTWSLAWENYLYTNREYGLEWKDGWRLDKNNMLAAGLEWRNTSITYINNYSDKSITNVGAYVEDKMSLGKRWTLTPGVRYDNHSLFGGHTTPRASLNYKADADTDIYLSWGQVFNAPTTDDLFWPYSSMGGWIVAGNPNLKPETGNTTTLGINKKLNKTTSMKASYFYSDLKDAIRWDSTVIGGTYYSTPSNVDSMKKQGAEISLETKLSPEWRLSAGYSWLKMESKAGSAANYVADVTNPQPNGYRLGVNYAQKAWDVSLNLTGATGRSLERFSSSSYWVLDLAVNYKIDKNAKLYFKWNNITNQAYEVWGNSSIGNFPMPASNWQIGLKYSF